jgi:hypothetical protein
MELFAPRDLGAGGSPDIVSTENIRAKTARTAFTLESRPLCVAREGNATSAYRCRNSAAGSVRTSSGGVSGRRYAKAG